MATLALDTHRLVKRLVDAGFTNVQAETVTDIIAETRARDLGEVATKLDLAELRAALRDEINDLRSELKGEIDRLRNELKGEIDGLRNGLNDLRNGLNDLRNELNDLRSELTAELNDLRRELKGELNDLRSELTVEINGLRSELNALCTRIDRIEGTTATKSDLAAMATKADLAARETRLIMWLVPILLGQAGLIVGLVKFLG